MMRHWELQSKMLKRHYMSVNEKKLSVDDKAFKMNINSIKNG